MPASAPRRISSIDIVRGFVMVVMALDHVRDWVTNVRFAPEDLSRASVALFATRWITHFCAPTFFLLAGLGIGVLMQRQPGAADMTRYLLTRGVWLLVLELVITPIGWQFGFQLVPAFALVLWALGWSMIVMALLVHLPRGVLAVLSVAIIAGHNLFDAIRPASLGAFAPFWHVLHVPGFVIPNVLFIAYPLVPWVAVMSLGFVLADVYGWDPRRASLRLKVPGIRYQVPVHGVLSRGSLTRFSHEGLGQWRKIDGQGAAVMMRRLIFAIGVILAASTSAFAQLPFEHRPNKDPYRNLFSPEAERLKAATAAAVRARQAETQRCVAHSMRVVPANPDVDPKIRVAPPSDVDHKIKTVTPPTCKPE